MSRALLSAAIALGLATSALACSRTTHDTNVRPRATEARYDDRRAEERRAERRAEERRAEERRAEDRRAAERARERRLNERSDEADRPRRAIGGGPSGTYLELSESVAAARCEREERCGNIGPHGDFPTREECIRKPASRRLDGVNLQACSVVSQQRVDSCVAAIRQEACGVELNTATRLPACRSSNLCVR